MEYMIRLAQCHETFRVPELQSVATVVGVDLEIVSYDEFVCDHLRNATPSGESLGSAQFHS